MIRIRMPPQPEGHISLTVSPLLECVLSLHVLLGPKHHALQHGWVRRMRHLERGLRREVEAFGFIFRRQIPDLLGPHADGAPTSFGDRLSYLRRLPPETLVTGLTRPLYDDGGRGDAGIFHEQAVRATVLDRAAADCTRARATAALLLDDPVEFTDRLTRVLERYWEAVFADEWARLEAQLTESCRVASRKLATVGFWPLLGRLPNTCRFDPKHNELLISLPHEHAREVSAESPLVLTPSFFVWPHLLVTCDPPRPLALAYTAPIYARDAEPRTPPAELLPVLRALADDSRLRMLKLIAEHPRTTQELEPLVGLSRAGLSKSLQRLAQAGLITRKRDGYYVLYSLAPGQFDTLAAAITHYLSTGPN